MQAEVLTQFPFRAYPECLRPSTCATQGQREMRKAHTSPRQNFQGPSSNKNWLSAVGGTSWPHGRQQTPSQLARTATMAAVSRLCKSAAFEIIPPQVPTFRLNSKEQALSIVALEFQPFGLRRYFLLSWRLKKWIPGNAGRDFVCPVR